MNFLLSVGVVAAALALALVPVARVAFLSIPFTLGRTRASSAPIAPMKRLSGST